MVEDPVVLILDLLRVVLVQPDRVGLNVSQCFEAWYDVSRAWLLSPVVPQMGLEI